jgi:hypothetical protein
MVRSSLAQDLGFSPDCGAEQDRLGFHVDGHEAGRKRDGWLEAVRRSPSRRFARLRRRSFRKEEGCLGRPPGRVFCSIDSYSYLSVESPDRIERV